MKAKVITLSLIGLFIYACSEDNSVVEEIETITEQEGSIETITEDNEFYKYKLVIEKLKNSREQNNDKKYNKIMQKKHDTINQF